jgi:hypothetical protein
MGRTGTIVFAIAFVMLHGAVSLAQAPVAPISTPQATKPAPVQVPPPTTFSPDGRDNSTQPAEPKSHRQDRPNPLVQLATGIAWPVALILVVLLFAFHPRLNRMLGLAKVVRKIKAGGVEMEINPEAVDAVRAELRQSVKELAEKAKDEYERMAKLMRIGEHLERVIMQSLPRILENNKIIEIPSDVRGTVHVQDIVFNEYLYQLTDYFPTRTGSGRRFPQRYGIIGRSWRLGTSLGEGNAFAAGKGEEKTLIEEWGMTREDVHARGKNQPAYLSVVLASTVDDDFPNGILYVDSNQVGAFGTDEVATKIAVQLETTPEVVALRKALERALAPLRLAAPNLDVRQLSR